MFKVPCEDVTLPQFYAGHRIDCNLSTRSSPPHSCLMACSNELNLLILGTESRVEGYNLRDLMQSPGGDNRILSIRNFVPQETAEMRTEVRFIGISPNESRLAVATENDLHVVELPEFIEISRFNFRGHVKSLKWFNENQVYLLAGGKLFRHFIKQRTNSKLVTEIEITAFEFAKNEIILGTRGGSVYKSIGCGELELVHRFPNLQFDFNEAVCESIVSLSDDRIFFNYSGENGYTRQLFCHYSLLLRTLGEGVNEVQYSEYEPGVSDRYVHIPEWELLVISNTSDSYVFFCRCPEEIEGTNFLILPEGRQLMCLDSDFQPGFCHQICLVTNCGKGADNSPEYLVDPVIVLLLTSRNVVQVNYIDFYGTMEGKRLRPKTAKFFGLTDEDENQVESEDEEEETVKIYEDEKEEEDEEKFDPKFVASFARFFKTYNKGKINDIPFLLTKYKGKEERVLEKLNKVYRIEEKEKYRKFLYKQQIAKAYSIQKQSKIHDLPEILNKYENRERELYLKVCRKYQIDPEPDIPYNPDISNCIRDIYFNRIFDIYSSLQLDHIFDLWNLLEKYRSKEHGLYVKVCKKYRVDPRPSIDPERDVLDQLMEESNYQPCRPIPSVVEKPKDEPKKLEPKKLESEKLESKKLESEKNSPVRPKIIDVELVSDARCDREIVEPKIRRIYLAQKSHKIYEVSELLNKYSGKEIGLYLKICRAYNTSPNFEEEPEPPYFNDCFCILENRVAPAIFELLKVSNFKDFFEYLTQEESLVETYRWRFIDCYLKTRSNRVFEVDSLVDQYFGKLHGFYLKMCKKYDIVPRDRVRDVRKPKDHEECFYLLGRRNSPTVFELPGVSNYEVYLEYLIEEEDLVETYRWRFIDCYSKIRSNRVFHINSIINKYFGKLHGFYLKMCKKYDIVPRDRVQDEISKSSREVYRKRIIDIYLTSPLVLESDHAQMFDILQDFNSENLCPNYHEVYLKVCKKYSVDAFAEYEEKKPEAKDILLDEMKEASRLVRLKEIECWRCPGCSSEWPKTTKKCYSCDTVQPDLQEKMDESRLRSLEKLGLNKPEQPTTGSAFLPKGNQFVKKEVPSFRPFNADYRDMFTRPVDPSAFTISAPPDEETRKEEKYKSQIFISPTPVVVEEKEEPIVETIFTAEEEEETSLRVLQALAEVLLQDLEKQKTSPETRYILESFRDIEEQLLKLEGLQKLDLKELKMPEWSYCEAAYKDYVKEIQKMDLNGGALKQISDAELKLNKLRQFKVPTEECEFVEELKRKHDKSARRIQRCFDRFQHIKIDPNFELDVLKKRLEESEFTELKQDCSLALLYVDDEDYVIVPEVKDVVVEMVETEQYTISTPHDDLNLPRQNAPIGLDRNFIEHFLEDSESESEVEPRNVETETKELREIFVEIQEFHQKLDELEDRSRHIRKRLNKKSQRISSPEENLELRRSQVRMTWHKKLHESVREDDGDSIFSFG